jgi:hypothetical protein
VEARRLPRPPRLNILAIDLARRFGWCRGEAGKIPESGSAVLRAPGDPNGLALGALARWIRDSVRDHGKPDLITVEHWLPPAGQKHAAIIEDGLRMNGCCHAIAGLFGITVLEPYAQTVRLAVCGRAFVPGDSVRNGKRLSNTKLMVLDTMTLRGYLPKGCADTDRADACALWCYAESTRFLSAPESFSLVS